MRRSHRAILTVLLTGLPATMLTAQEAAWKEALATYQQWIQRPSLVKRTIARERLAATLDPRAFELLVKSYAKPEEPAEPVRYLIASIAMNNFRGRVEAPVLDAWRKRHTRAEDAWLWFETEREPERARFDALKEQVLGRSDPFLRATALEALASAVDAENVPEGLQALCLQLLAAMPRQEPERALFTEGIAHIVLMAKKQVREPAWKPVATALIRQLDAPGIAERTQMVLSRFLARTFGSANWGTESGGWLGELERQPAGGRKSSATVAFARVKAMGRRFVYVIDASDSMCKKVTERDLGPVTGGARPKAPEPGQPGHVPKEGELDWNRIRNRFDVAREFCRASLNNLVPEHSFAVVLFGDEAKALTATPRLMLASRENVRAAIAELDGIKDGPPTANRPDGVLRGRTNLHAGIVRAFQMTRSGEVRRAEYVDAKAMSDGCDAIFILSDGAPSWDDYEGLDARDPEDQAGDPESGVKHDNVPQLTFSGPYGLNGEGRLQREVERLNLFRKAEIHCVGIGEANHGLLTRIARLGGGQAIRIDGKK